MDRHRIQGNGQSAFRNRRFMFHLKGCETKFFIQAASGRASLRAACALSLYFQKSSKRRLL